MKKILFFLLISTAAFGQAGPPYNGSSRSINTTPQGDELGTIVRQVPQDIDRIGFTKVLSNSVDSDWGTIVSGIGSGQDVDQTGGNLVITTGTTARSETIIRSTESWTGGLRLRARSTLSSRIVNTNFFVELVDVIGDGLSYTISSATVIVVTFPSGHGFTAENVGQSMYLGLFSGTGTFLSGRYPIASVSGDNITFTVSGFAAGTGTCSAFGWNYYQLHYTGTTATNVNFDTQRNGWATGATNATINTTASPGHLAIITGNDLIATFADQLVASATSIQQSVRANRNENIPDDKNLRLQIRIANGSTAPASSITWTIGLISVSHYANTDVAIQDVKPQGLVALPVEIMRSTTNAVTVSSGTVTTVSTLTTLSNGQTAHSSASTGSPLRAAGRVTPTTIAGVDVSLVAGDAADVPSTTGNQVVTKEFATAELDYNFDLTTVGTVTTLQPLVLASGTANVRNYITSLTVSSDALGAAGNAWILDGQGAIGSSVTIATPGVFTSTAHDLKVGDAIVFTSLGTITGISTNTVYYITATSFAATTFTVATTRGGTALQITGSTSAFTFYRLLFPFRFQTTAIGSPQQVFFPNPLRSISNGAINFLIPTTLTSGSIYLTVNGYRGF
jgi:hypothetical protein